MPITNVLATLPEMDWMTSWMMNRRIEDNDPATIEELIDTCVEMGVDLQACQTTQDLMDYDKADFYEGVTTGVGVATALQHMGERTSSC